MDELLLQSGTTHLRISIAGIDPDTGTTDSATFRLTLYAYDEGPPVRSLFTAQLEQEQASRLYQYLQKVSLISDSGQVVSGRFIELGEHIDPELVASFLAHPDLSGNPEVVRALLELNPELTKAILQNEIDAVDIQSLAYRREQLRLMARLLNEPEFFSTYQDTLGVRGKEAVWQNFFEHNQWILGYALNYIIGEGVSPERLEQVVAGHSIAGAGKRVDALLQTRGILKSLCYVEIKTHETPILHSSEYRAEVWEPSFELSGAVAQAQKTVQLAMEHLTKQLDIRQDQHDGAFNGIFYNYSPKSIVICGNLSEFHDGDGVNLPKLSSFELYRGKIFEPEIITFDELHNRAAAILAV